MSAGDWAAARGSGATGVSCCAAYVFNGINAIYDCNVIYGLYDSKGISRSSCGASTRGQVVARVDPASDEGATVLVAALEEMFVAPLRAHTPPRAIPSPAEPPSSARGQ